LKCTKAPLVCYFEFYSQTSEHIHIGLFKGSFLIVFIVERSM